MVAKADDDVNFTLVGTSTDPIPVWQEARNGVTYEISNTGGIVGGYATISPAELAGVADGSFSNLDLAEEAVQQASIIASGQSSVTGIERVANFGSELGSQIGELIGGSNPFAQIAAGTLLGALGQQLATEVGSDFSRDLQTQANAVGESFGEELEANAETVGISVVSSQLTNDILHALGINGFGGKLAGVAVNTVIDNTITYEFSAFLHINIPGGAVNPQSLLETNFAAFFGQQLGALIISPTTQAGAVLGSLASTVGAAIGSTFGPVGTFIGSFIGDVIGTLLGDLFGSRPRPIPMASASVVLQLPDANYALGDQTSANGGDLTYVAQIATTAATTLNGIINEVVGAEGTVQNTTSPTQTYGLNEGQLYITINGSTTNVSSANDAIDIGVLGAIRQTQLISGNIFEKRAISNSNAPDTTTFLLDLQVAGDYATYRQNWQAINQIIAASPNSAYASGWIVTLQRANELGLDEFAKSDFYGGLKGLLDSFPLAQEGIGYEDISLTPDYNAPGWVIVSLPQTVGAGVFSSLITSSPDGSSFEIDPGGFAQGGFTQEPGVSGNGGDYINSYSVATPVTLSETVGNNILIGSQGNDHLTASSGYDWLDGYSGNDVLVAKTGDAVLLGGDGNDHITVGNVPSPGTYYLSGGAGNDTLTADGGVATFVGGTGKDTLNGGSGKNTFIVDPGLAGGSTITGGSGTNTLSFERVQTGLDLDLNYDDLTNPSPSAQQVSSDTFSIYGDTISNLQNITGGSGNDFIVNTAGMSSVIIGGAGDDDLNGWGGNDTLEGGPGADNLNGWSGINTLSYESSSAGVYINLATWEAYGGDADGDTIQNFSNVTGSNYNDTLAGNDLVNTLSGGGGDDTFLRSAGGDSYSGGDGFDTVDYSSLYTSGITANLETGVGGGLAAGDTYSSIEKIIGTGSNDVVTASSTGSTFEGAGGSDAFNGGDGSDTYILGRGDGVTTVNDNNTASNTLQVGPGLGFDDLWFGAQGGSSGFLQFGIRGTSDEVSVTGNFGAYPVSSDDVVKTLDLDGSTSVDISRVTFVSGGDSNADVLQGYSDKAYFNFLIGYEGADTLEGNGTKNTVVSQNANVLFGGTGNDVIWSSNGDDQYLFERGDGRDTVHDSGGSNTLIFGSSVAASDVIYQVVGNNLFIGLSDPDAPNKTASQVSDYVKVIGGSVETINSDTGSVQYAGIQTVEAGGSTIDLTKAGVVNWTIQDTDGGGTGGGGGGGGTGGGGGVIGGGGGVSKGAPTGGVITVDDGPAAPTAAAVPVGASGKESAVVIDLDGSGLQLTSVGNSDIATVDGNGVVTRMSWVGPTNGLLVSDRDGTGAYNTTDDLSFVGDAPSATSGLQGLQGWDSNGDGVLDGSDSDWDQLKVWVDANQDGVAEPGEVETLEQAGVSSISLTEAASGFDPTTTFDSYYTGTATVTHTDGTTTSAYDTTFARRFLDETTDADSPTVSWDQLTGNATIGLILTGDDDGDDARLSAKAIAGAHVDTSGGEGISAADQAKWDRYFKRLAAAERRPHGSMSGGQYLAGIETSTAHPAGYDELSGRASGAQSRSAEPIVLDLSGTGLSEIAPTASSVSFDAAHTGTPQTTGWIGPSDAILAFDANGDGEVDPATEITFKPDVATAKTSIGGLEPFDTNKDGYLDAGDAAYANFLVWRDANGNGLSDPGETETLAQAGVAKLSLTPTVVTPDSGDLSSNVVLAQAQVVLTDGTTRTAYDVGLGVKGASTQAGATSGPTPARPTPPRTSTPQTPEIQPTARAAPTSSSLTAQGTPSSSAGASAGTSLARAAEDGPQTPQGAQWASAEDIGEVAGWWTTSSVPTFSAASLSAFRLGGQTTDPLTPVSSTSVTPDAATQQRQLLLRQSLASFKAPTSNASAVWTRQPAADLSPNLAAAASKPLPARTAAIGGVAG